MILLPLKSVFAGTSSEKLRTTWNHSEQIKKQEGWIVLAKVTRNVRDFDDDTMRKAIDKGKFSRIEDILNNTYYRIDENAETLEELINSIEFGRSFIFKMIDILCLFDYGILYNIGTFTKLYESDTNKIPAEKQLFEQDFFTDQDFANLYYICMVYFEHHLIKQGIFCNKKGLAHKNPKSKRLCYFFRTKKGRHTFEDAQKTALAFIGCLKEDLKLYMLKIFSKIKPCQFNNTNFAKRATTHKSEVFDEIKEKVLDKAKSKYNSFSKVTSLKRKLPLYFACQNQDHFVEVLSAFATMNSLDYSKSNKIPARLELLNTLGFLWRKNLIFNFAQPFNSEQEIFHFAKVYPYIAPQILVQDFMFFIFMIQSEVENNCNLDLFKKLRLPWSNKLYVNKIFSHLNDLSKMNEVNFSSVYLDTEAKLAYAKKKLSCKDLKKINQHQKITKRNMHDFDKEDIAVIDEIIKTNDDWQTLIPDLKTLVAFLKDRKIPFDKIASSRYKKDIYNPTTNINFYGIYSDLDQSLFFSYIINTVHQKGFHRSAWTNSFEFYARDYKQQLEKIWDIDTSVLKTTQEERLLACVFYYMAINAFEKRYEEDKNDDELKSILDFYRNIRTRRLRVLNAYKKRVAFDEKSENYSVDSKNTLLLEIKNPIFRNLFCSK